MEKMTKLPPKTLDDWLHHLESLHSTEIEMGLDRILQVYRRMKPDYHGARVITVGGTNGKGTTVATLQALLLAQGKSVGAYTSPHINRFNERVCINGIDAEDSQLVSAFEAVESCRGSTSLTYFEFGTLVALHIFTVNPLDFILLEVGLGGRLDAVNIVDSDIAIITSVDIDHVEWLGPDRESIGYEKAGILRAGGKAVYGELNPPGSVRQQVVAQNIDMRYYGSDFGYSDSDKTVFYLNADNERCSLAFVPGNIPVSNQMCALQALQMLGLTFTPAMVRSVFHDVRVSGRMEMVSLSPQVMVDVAHNPHAANYLCFRLKQLLKPGAKVIAVFSMLGDKDIAGVIEQMKPVVDRWVVFPLDLARAASLESIVVPLDSQGQISESVVNAQAALSTAKKYIHKGDDIIVVFGSFFTVAAIKQNIGLNNGKE